MLKTNPNGGNGAVRALPRHAVPAARQFPRRTEPRRGGHRAGQIELAPDTRAEGGRAQDPRGRAPGGKQAQRGGNRGSLGRLARPGARGLPRARGIRPRAARKEPRRIRPADSDRGDRRNLRTARGAGRICRPKARAGDHARASAQAARPRRTDGKGGCEGRCRRVPRDERRVPRSAGRARRQHKAGHVPATRQRASLVSTGIARARWCSAGFDARAPRHRRQDRCRRAFRGGPGAV